MANCRPAARHVRNVTTKSRTANQSRCGFAGADTAQAGNAAGLSGGATFRSIAAGADSLSLFTEYMAGSKLCSHLNLDARNCGMVRRLHTLLDLDQSSRPSRSLPALNRTA